MIELFQEILFKECDKMKKIALKLAAGSVAAIIAAEAGKTAVKKIGSKKLDGKGETVLITGGSGGIGFEIAKLFAERGFDLVLTSRSEEHLLEAKRTLEEKYCSKVEVIVADLSLPGGAEKLYGEIRERNIVVDRFVNNAGAGKSSDLAETDEEVLKSLMNLNVVSFTLLNRYIVSDMIKRGKGKILNVSSLSGYLPDPGLNIYGATKAYERYLGEAMYGELRGTGVTVSTLCPGPVKTNWSKNAGRKDSVFSLGAETVAKEAFDGMENGDLIIVPGLHFKALRLGANFVPTTFKIKLLRSFQNGLKG